MSATEKLSKLNAPIAHCWYTLKPGARILMYHRVTDTAVTGTAGPDQLTVSPALFEQQIAWLAQYRRILPLSSLLSEIENGNVDGNAVAVTFDDGYLDNLTHAIPILEKYNAPASIYITSDFAAQTLRHPRYANEPGRLHLNWLEVKSLAEHALIEIGSHTVSHPMLSELSAEQAQHEIAHSKAEIERQIESRVTSFCYPAGNFTEREKQIVQACGYMNALSVKPGVTRVRNDLLALRRTEVTYKDTPDNLALKLCGSLDVFHRILDFRRERKFARQRLSSQRNTSNG